MVDANYDEYTPEDLEYKLALGDEPVPASLLSRQVTRVGISAVGPEPTGLPPSHLLLFFSMYEADNYTPMKVLLTLERVRDLYELLVGFLAESPAEDPPQDS